MTDSAVVLRIDEIIAAARLFVIPLYTIQGRNRGFDSAGSAVLISLTDGPHLAVTAAHVLQNVAPLPLLTWGTNDTGLIRLKYANAIASLPDERTANKDRVDLAVLPLDAVTADALLAANAQFLAADRIRHDWDIDGAYVALGYPHAINRVKRSGPKLKTSDAHVKVTARMKPYVIPNSALLAPCDAVPDEQYRNVGADLRLNVVFAFRHKNLVDSDGVPFPHPRGMSGGAIFRIGTSGTLVHADQVELVGIGTEYYEKIGLLVGAGASAVLHLLYSAARAFASA